LKTKELDLTISITLFQLISHFFIIILSFLLFKNFSLTNENFFAIALVLLFISIFLSFTLTNIALKPYFDKNRFLDKLLKNTLHELNVPIATIDANLNLLKRKELNEKKLIRLSRISLASKKLLKLYSELDYFIKKEINRVESETFNLKELLLQELEYFQDIKRDITFKIDTQDLKVIANRSGFAKVINNLISNAIKYNRKDGFVKIELSDNLLTIEDSGIGLESDEIFKIFDRYYQSDNSNSGYGIGLNIVKSFCDEYKIDIKIVSKKDKGSKFILDLETITQKKL